MTQDPDKPKDDGKVRLPRVDAAMNKLAPMSAGGGKGSSADDKMTKKEEAKVVKRGRKRMDRCIQAESENRKNGLDDLKFKGGDQWPADVAAQRNFDKRPTLTVNKLPTFVHQITNDLRQNRPTINISPVGDKSDPEVAKMYRGLIRAIERGCSADIAYDTAADHAVSMGFGYWRILTEFESPASFNQVIVIKRIRNPFTVYLDPDHQEPDGADARFGFVSEMVPRDQFKDDYPDADQMPWSQSGIGDTFKNWIDRDAIRIAEYFEVKEENSKLVELSNGHIGWEDELHDETLRMIGNGTVTVEQSRESCRRKVMWYKMTGKEILEKKEWAGSSVPIVKMIGDELDIEGKVKYQGVIRHAKDAQRMYNYWRTAETEMVALGPKAKWLAEEGQIEGHEAEWKQANIKNYPVLKYKGTSIQGHPVPPPIRVAPEGPPAGVEAAIQGAAQDMIATTGIRFDATMNERMMDESGKAIRELRRSGDLGSFHYADNFARSLRRTGHMMVELIPKIYDTPRILTILREDDTEEQVKIDPSMQQGFQEIRPQPTPQQPKPKMLKIFNPNFGKYGVTVTIGPSYATKRIEASESMIAFAKAVPQIAPIIADIIAKNQDWPGSSEIATRIAKSLPANLLTPEQKDVPPQIQALLQQMNEQIQALRMERQQLMVALNEKMTDRALAQDKINKDFEAKLLKIAADIEKTIAHGVTQKIEMAVSNAVNDLTRALEPKPEKTPTMQ